MAALIIDWIKINRNPNAADFKQQKERILDAFDYWIESQPLECVMLMGIEKLKKDYYAHLVGKSQV